MDALTALRLQIEWGADEAILSDPVDRLRPETPSVPPAAPELAPSQPRKAAPPRADVSPSNAAEQARKLAEAAQSLEELRGAITGFYGCALRDTAASTVLPEGPPDASLILIGEAPTAEDDRAGHPFAGVHGAFLDKVLASINLMRNSILLAPLMPWRPPGDRPPSASELAICLPFLCRLLALAPARHALILGPVSTRALFGPGKRVKRGAWSELEVPGRATELRVLPSVSLVQAKRAPAMKRDLWADLRQIHRVMMAEITQT